jgi:uncharacterized membrane protein YeiH
VAIPVPHINPVLLLESAAVVTAALSAMITAAKKEMDLVGVYALAVVTSFGGGAIRDLIIDRRPFFFVERWEYFVVIMGLCVPFVYSRQLYMWSRTLVARADLVDALGLGFFTVSGTALAVRAGMPAIICALLGVITSNGGGVIRDLIINEIPQLFKHGRLQAVAALFGATIYLGLLHFELTSDSRAAAIAVVVTVALRLTALWQGTTLPRPHWLQTGNWKVPPGP